MALVLADRVRETSSTTGTGSITLDGAVIGYQTFGTAIGAGNTCYYTISNPGTSEWEVGIGTVGSGTLARTSILSSSTGSTVSFTSGNKDVFVTYPSEKAVYLDASGNVVPSSVGPLTVTSLTDSGLTENRVTYAGVGGLLKDSANLTFDGTTLTATGVSATQVDITAQGDLRLQDTTGGQYVALQAPATLASSYTLTLPVDDGTNGQALVTDGNGVLSWFSAASGDVYGPASATDNAVARYDGTTGKIIQNSAVTIADTTGDMAGVGTLTLNSTLGVKTAASAEYNILVGGNLTGGVNSGGLRFQSQIQSDVTSNARGIMSIPSTAAAAFTIGNLEHFFAGQGSLGAGSSISNQYGYRAASSLTGATNNYGFFGDIASGTGRWNFYAAGTAANYFGGNTIVEVTDNTNAALRITQIGSGNALLVEDSANPDSSPFVVTADGNVLIGTTTPTTTTYPLYIESLTGIVAIGGTNVAGTSPTIGVGKRRTGGSSVASGDSLGKYSGFGWDGASLVEAARMEAVVDGTPGTNDMPGRLVFSTTADGASSPTERMRITNAGRVGIGGTPTASFSVFNAKEMTGATTQIGYGLVSTIQSDVTSLASGYRSNLTTQATAFTLANLYHYEAVQSAFGAGSTVTNQYGFVAGSTLTGATNNYGFYSSIASGTGRWNFYAAGTAANVFVGTTSIGGTVGAESLRVTPVASAVNYWQLQGSVTGVTPYASAVGSDANVSMGFLTKGTGVFDFWTGDAAFSRQFRVSHTASAVNYLQVTGGATGNPPTLFALGSDTNISLEYYSKGTGSHVFYTNGAFPSRATQFLVTHTASAVNYLQVTGGATGATTTLSAQGSDTNVDITLTPKGDGYVVVDSAYSPNLTLTDAATIAWNTGTAGGQVATFTFVSTNRTVGAPTNLKNGGFYALAVIQNAGSNTLTWNSIFKWAGGTAPTLSTAAGAKDYFVFRSDGTNLYQQGISQAVA